MFVQHGIEVVEEPSTLRLIPRPGWSRWVAPVFSLVFALVPVVWIVQNPGNWYVAVGWFMVWTGVAGWSLYGGVKFVEADGEVVVVARRLGSPRRYEWRDIREIIVEERTTRGSDNERSTSYWPVLALYNGAEVRLPMGGSEDRAHLVRRQLDQFGQRQGVLSHPADFSEWLQGSGQKPG